MGKSIIFQMIIRQCLFNRVRFCVNHLRFQSSPRTNPLGIQMLSSKLHEQLFTSVGEPNYSEENVQKSKVHLQKFELGSNESEKLENIEFNLPPLESEDLNEHFEIIARNQSKPYVDLINQLIQAEVPTQPKKWKYANGWTKFVSVEIILSKRRIYPFRYSADGKTMTSVDYPEEKVLVFDVETLVCEGNFAVLAVALSPNHWFVI